MQLHPQNDAILSFTNPRLPQSNATASEPKCKAAAKQERQLDEAIPKLLSNLYLDHSVTCDADVLLKSVVLNHIVPNCTDRCHRGCMRALLFTECTL